MSRAACDAVVLCECFARDGLQHESTVLPTEVKVALIDGFSAMGFQRIETTSFTHPGNVPQFSDADEVLRRIQRRAGTSYKATCVNLRSIERALAAADAGFGPDEISMVLVATDALSARAFKRTRTELREVVAEMLMLAAGRFHITGTISGALGCHYEGAVDPRQVIADAAWFLERGVRSIAIADTTGMGDPASVARLFGELLQTLPDIVPIAHFHDTRGMGLANCLAAYQAGVRHFDCAIGGTGGHPAQLNYGQGHTGNVCTEDLAVMFETMGVPTGLHLEDLLPVVGACEKALGRSLDGRTARSGLGLLSRRIASRSAHV